MTGLEQLREERDRAVEILRHFAPVIREAVSPKWATPISREALRDLDRLTIPAEKPPDKALVKCDGGHPINIPCIDPNCWHGKENPLI